MSRHEGISCNSCLKINFTGRRYKCLVCYDYDLCGACYDVGAISAQHALEHPVQCILTRSDVELYCGGEGPEQQQSYTCAYCGTAGYTEALLQEHTMTEHADATIEVICPVCAATPGSEPNHVTDDLASHLAFEHRALRDFEEAQLSGMRHIHRMPQVSRRGHVTTRSRMPATRSAAPTTQSASAAASFGLLSPSGRDSSDPITELLSQLSGARSRVAAVHSVSSQLQQLEQQLQSTRQQLERLPFRGHVPEYARLANSSLTGYLRPGYARLAMLEKENEADVVRATGISMATETAATATDAQQSQFLLTRPSDVMMSESERQGQESMRADRSLFAQELLLESLIRDFSDYRPFTTSTSIASVVPVSNASSTLVTANTASQTISTMSETAAKDKPVGPKGRGEGPITNGRAVGDIRSKIPGAPTSQRARAAAPTVTAAPRNTSAPKLRGGATGGKETVQPPHKAR